MKKTLYLTRHGETKWNTIRKMQGQLNSPLTDIGLKQAQWLKARMDKIELDVIYTSPLGRAFDTARIIQGTRDIPLLIDDRLKELYFGSWEGQKKDDLSRLYPEMEDNLWNHPEDYVSYDGENLQEIIERSKSFYEEILSSDYKNILVVSHAIMLKSFISMSLKKELKDFWTGPHIQPASLTKAEIEGNKIDYDFIADTSHYKIKSQFNGWFSDDKSH